MSHTKQQIIQQLVKYLENAQDWDAYEIVEWAFGYDDPLVEKFREEIGKHEGQGSPVEATKVQS